MNIAPQHHVEYKVPDQLMQAVVDTLSTLPARQSRGLLNSLEHLCVSQDKERLEAERAAERERIRSELQEPAVAADGNTVQAPAPVPAPT